MGRTVLPFSQAMKAQQQQWGTFRRTLRAEDQEKLDELFERAKLHAQTGIYAPAPDPAESFFIAVLLEYGKLIDRLQERLAVLESRPSRPLPPLSLAVVEEEQRGLSFWLAPESEAEADEAAEAPLGGTRQP